MKQVVSAAKRAGKKRPAASGTASTPSEQPSAKKKRASSPPPSGHARSAPPDEAAALEASLRLPAAATDEAAMRAAVLVTNRAPLVLAFGVALLAHTMPAQPLSSRLSLAQAAVSLNSRSKAVSLGIERGRSAEDEGWGVGQAAVRVMGREVRTMKRVGWKVVGGDAEAHGVEGESVDDVALWGLDLEALKKSSGTDVKDGTGVGLSFHLPIHTPQSARSYLLKAFDSKPTQQTASSPKKTPSASSSRAEKERNLGLLLGALDLLFKSWSPVLSKEDLDQKAWSWYVQTRPSVPDGVSGWGAKGELRLSDILQLARKG